ncbi:MAG: [LysW]-lysine hydrolase [Planctomycetota bacterium]|nr:[LysW]-lysine hydrolase [Planctomycetota bacterium]
MSVHVADSVNGVLGGAAVSGGGVGGGGIPPLSREELIASDAAAVDCLVQLVRTQSLSGHESRLAMRLVEWMQALGLRAWIDENGNAIGERGPADAAATVVLLGHMDTVPGEIPVRIEGDWLHGRGSVDAKGPLATCLWAAARCQLPPDCRVVVIGAVEEETATSRGARGVLDAYHPQGCIIAEPSGSRCVTLGYKGRLVVRVSVELERVHTAAARGSSMDLLHRFWQRTLERVSSENAAPSRGKGAFDQIQATIRSWETDPAGLMDGATMEVAFRLPVGVSPEQMDALCRELAAELAAEWGLAEGSLLLSCAGAEHPVASPRHDVCAVALSDALRARSIRPTLKVKTGTCDMNVVGPVWRCPIVAYGPGDSALDHTPHERVSIAEYLEAIGVLSDGLRNLFGSIRQG